MIIFYFQAEDGIRDKLVTGVQTCALPILAERFSVATPRLAVVASGPGESVSPHLVECPAPGPGDRYGFSPLGLGRSEERRVGKECRCWWWRSRLKKNR